MLIVKLPIKFISVTSMTANESCRERDIRESLNRFSWSALLVVSKNRDDHKSRDEGRSLNYDGKERNAMAPQSVARGAPRSGDRAAAGMPDRAKVYMGEPIALFYRNPYGTRLRGLSALSGS